MFKITHEVDKLPEKFTGIAVNTNGDKFWLLNNEYHRVDGPAIEYANGAKEWFLNGQYHRVNGPAIEYANGYKEWWFKGHKRFASQTWQKELDKFKPTCNNKVVEIDGKKYKLVLTEG